jgi:protein dithiol oxidoreductase (disulfide-forming)
MMRFAALTGFVAMLVWGPYTTAAEQWVEGRHYYRVQPAQRTNVAAGKVEVAEAISYGCPACNEFLPFMADLKKQLPPSAEIVYVHASFNTSEQWPMFQRAFYTSTAMGLVPKTHEQMFKAIWATGELAVVDSRTGRLKQPPPTLDDVAQFYARTAGVDSKKFLATAKSFAVDVNIKRAEEWLKATRVDQTPTFVINGKYRVTDRSAGGRSQLAAVIVWLVNRELGAASQAPAR